MPDKQVLGIWVRMLVVHVLGKYLGGLKIMVTFWIPIIIWHRTFRGYPKRDHTFDNHPCDCWILDPLGAISP